MNKKGLIIFFPIFISVGILFNFLWENAQCKLFFIHQKTPANMQSMVMASIGDVLLMLVMHFILAQLQHDYFFYLKKWTLSFFIKMELTAFLISMSVEYWGINSKRWSYTSLAPIIPILKISVIPVLQFLLLSPIIYFLTKKIFNYLTSHFTEP